MIQDSRIKFVFFGTPGLSVEILEHLKGAGFIPQLIVTNPDRPQGRKMLLTPPPVKVWAQKNEIKFLQPEELNQDSGFKIQDLKPDLFIVAAYGKILPKKILSIPEKGTLNIHYSLLPKYRGASPIESTILNDDKETGVSIMLMDEKMDHGPVIAQRALQITNHNIQKPNKSQITNRDKDIQTPIQTQKNLQLTTYNPPERTVSVRAGLQLMWPMRASELRDAMNKIACTLLAEVIPRWIAGEINAVEQDHSKATYTQKFTKNDGLLDLAGDPYKNFLKIRAFDDSIGTHFFAHKQGKKIRIVIKDAEFRDLPAQADGKLILTRVLPEGKKEISYNEFERGLKV